MAVVMAISKDEDRTASRSVTNTVQNVQRWQSRL
jgi:hypothetical protein